MILWPDDGLEKSLVHEDEYVRRIKNLVAQTPESPGKCGTVLTDRAEHDLRIGFRTESIIAIRCGMSVADIRVLAELNQDELKELVKEYRRRRKDRREQAASATINPT